MKSATFGLSPRSYCGDALCIERPAKKVKEAWMAVSCYRNARENGAACDSPPYAFPNDGRYSWSSCSNRFYKIRYTEGLKDRGWMEARDRNYLSRLKKEKPNQGGRLLISPAQLANSADARAVRTNCDSNLHANLNLPNHAHKPLSLQATSHLVAGEGRGYLRPLTTQPQVGVVSEGDPPSTQIPSALPAPVSTTPSLGGAPAFFDTSVQLRETVDNKSEVPAGNESEHQMNSRC
jgi:hypothetical protein